MSLLNQSLLAECQSLLKQAEAPPAATVGNALGRTLGQRLGKAMPAAPPPPLSPPAKAIGAQIGKAFGQIASPWHAGLLHNPGLPPAIDPRLAVRQLHNRFQGPIINWFDRLNAAERLLGSEPIHGTSYDPFNESERGRVPRSFDLRPGLLRNLAWEVPGPMEPDNPVPEWARQLAFPRD